MDLAVRPASLTKDREELISLLERNFPNYPMRDLSNWRHATNPAGPAWSWVVYDRQNGVIGAMASVFPRPMYADGKLVMCGQVAEFAVDSAYRSLGPAIMLQRASFEPVDSGAIALCYDCPPNNQGLSTFIRLGLRPSCQLTRYAFPLRTDEFFVKKLGRGTWTKPLIASANFVLNTRLVNRRIPGLEIQILNGRFSEEFTRLDQIVPSSGIVRSSRSAEMLNWRYRDRYESDVEVLVARQGGEALAFLAFIVSPEGRASILDLFGLQLEKTGLPLLKAAIELCRGKQVVCLEGYCSESSELRTLFEAGSFRPRESVALVIPYAKPGTPFTNLAWPVAQAELLA